MISKLNIRSRVIAAISVTVLLVTSVLMYLALAKVNDLMDDSERRELKSQYAIAMSDLNTSGKLAVALATVISLNPDNQKDFAENNRDALADRNLPIFKVMKSEFAARQFQFHKPPAFSYFRVHKPEKYGDDLSSFRRTVVETNTTKKPIMGLEKGVAGIGIRGVVPVSYQGQHTGSVEFGMSFGQSFFDDFKKAHGVDIALYIKVDEGLKVFGSTLGDEIVSDRELIQKVLSGDLTDNFYQSEYKGKPTAVYLNTAKDYSGKPIGVVEIIMDTQHNITTKNDVKTLFFITGLIVLVLGLVASYLVSKGITSPIIAATEAMRDIAEGDGDLTKRLPDKANDEVGSLARAFNKFSIKVHNTVEKASLASVSLAGSAEKLAAITAKSVENIDRQHLEMEQVAAAMNQMVATVQEIAKNAEDASQVAKRTNDATLEGRNNVEQVVEAINVLASDINQAENVIMELEKQTGAIDSILEVIRNIAEQTNLLALNAAIEAARAGEHGRGFAVVADEVRNLASKTQDSTEEIQSMIEMLQSGSKNAVKAMQTSIDRSETTVDIARTAEASLDEITSSVNAINDMNMQIATAATEQVAVSDEINKNISNINEVVTHSAESADQISKSSDDLAVLASDIQSTMGQFKL